VVAVVAVLFACGCAWLIGVSEDVVVVDSPEHDADAGDEAAAD
jgi:hypothetical protein